MLSIEALNVKHIIRTGGKCLLYTGLSLLSLIASSYICLCTMVGRCFCNVQFCD